MAADDEYLIVEDDRFCEAPDFVARI